MVLYVPERAEPNECFPSHLFNVDLDCAISWFGLHVLTMNLCWSLLILLISCLSMLCPFAYLLFHKLILNYDQIIFSCNLVTFCLYLTKMLKEN